MRKILVTGAGGFVGARILDQWRGRYELCTFPHGFSADSDEAAVRALIAREKPDVISIPQLFPIQPIVPAIRKNHSGRMSCCPNGLQKRPLKPEQNCWRSAPIRYTLAVREAALCPKRFLFPQPMSMAATSWKPNSGCLPSTRTPYCCGQPGCMISRAIGSLSGATFR